MSANSEWQRTLVPPGYDLVAARTRLYAARLLEDLAEPEDVTAERRARLDAGLAARRPRPRPPAGPVPAPERHPEDDVTRERLRRLMPGRRATTPDDDHAARLLAGVTKEPR